MERFSITAAIARTLTILVGLFLASPVLGDPYPSVDLRVPGLPPTPLYTNPDDSTIRTVLEQNRVWEDLETRWILHTIRPGDVFVDVGANIGYYTVIAAKIVGEQGHVYAFEPDPTSFAILKANVERNGLTNVTLEQKALSNEPGSLRLFLAHENKGDHRIFDEQGAARPYIDVEALRLDDYAPLKDRKVDFIKVDTQGAEGIILEGMGGTVAANPRLVMVMEYTPSSLRAVGTDPAKFLDTLEEMDFRFFNLGMGFGSIVPPPLPAATLHTTGDQFANLFMLPGLSRLQALDLRILEAAEALGVAAASADTSSWEAATRAELRAHPWIAPAVSVSTLDAGSAEVMGVDGCVDISAPGFYRVSFADLPAGATALRLRSRSTGDDAGFVGLREVVSFSATGSAGKRLSDTPLYRPREPQSPLYAGVAQMRLRPNGPDIVQMRLPADMTGDAGGTLEFLLDWPTGVAGRLCGLVSTMVDPLNFDVEVAIRTPVDERDARLGAAVLALFGERAPEFSGLRQQLALAEQERAEFQTLTPEAIQGWIREPRDG